MSTFVDKNFRSYTESGTIDTVPELMDAGPEFNDTLKCSSNVRDLRIANKTVVNRKEDCVDLCRVYDGTFRNLTLRPKGENGITLKGASAGNYFPQLRFESHGKRCDIELGQFDNYWYPGRPATRGNVFEIEDVADSAPIHVNIWDAEQNEISGPNRFTVTKVPKAVWLPYFLFRYSWLRVENLVRRLRGLTPIATK